MDWDWHFSILSVSTYVLIHFWILTCFVDWILEEWGLKLSAIYCELFCRYFQKPKRTSEMSGDHGGGCVIRARLLCGQKGVSLLNSEISYGLWSYGYVKHTSTWLLKVLDVVGLILRSHFTFISCASSCVFSFVFILSWKIKSDIFSYEIRIISGDQHSSFQSQRASRGFFAWWHHGTRYRFAHVGHRARDGLLDYFDPIASIDVSYVPTRWNALADCGSIFLR